MTGPTSATPEQVKSCCAAAYSSHAVAAVLGEHHHPGGAALTRRLADRLALRPGERVLDVASGPGTTALLFAREYAVTADGVELAATTVERARATAEAAGLGHAVRFHHGDAERLPFPDATFDAVVCECALCTFPDKATAVGELVRILRPGGRVGITDITVDPERLDDRLRGLAGWVACLADARTGEDYQTLLCDAGLRVAVVEGHDQALAAMVDRIDARLRALRIAGRAIPALAGVGLDAALRITKLARQAVADGVAGYALLTAIKPTM